MQPIMSWLSDRTWELLALSAVVVIAVAAVAAALWHVHRRPPTGKRFTRWGRR